MFADRVIESSSTQGTGNYELIGAVGSGRTFAQDFPDGDTLVFYATSLDGTKWEKIRGVLGWGPPRTLTRATVLKSSNAGAKIDWQPTDQYFVYSIADADAEAGLTQGNLAEGVRPYWVRRGGRWLDYVAGLAVSWIDKLATGASSDIRIGRYDAVKNAYFSDGRRPWTAVGAANKVIAAADIGGVFTQNNSGADRTFTLPAHDADGVGEGFKVGGLGLTAGGQYGILLTPAAGDGIEGGADAAVKRIPGGVRFDVEWDTAGDTWRVTYLNTVPMVWSGRRQTVPAGPVTTAGLPSFLPSTNGALSLTEQNVSATARMVLTAANGWDWQGRPNDRVGVSLSNQQWTSLAPNRPADTPNYLYKVLNTDGAPTPGSTILPPIYQRGGTPDATNGQFTFNISEMKGYLGNGTTAPEVFVVFVGEAATDGSGVISTVAYAYNGRYERAWTDTLPSSGVQVTASHNIGVQPLVVDFIMECTTTDKSYPVGRQLQGSSVFATNGAQSALATTAKLIEFMPGGFQGQSYNADSVTQFTLASWKYKFIADRGWG